VISDFEKIRYINGHRMLHRFDPIACQTVEKAEEHKFYHYHVTKVVTSAPAIEATRPELSARHQVMAVRARLKRQAFIKARRCPIRATSRTPRLPYTSSRVAFASRCIPEIDPYSSPMFPTPTPVVPPDRLNFLASYHKNQTPSRAASTAQAPIRASVQVAGLGGWNSADQIIGINFDSEPSSSEEDDLATS
jgi:hypothetical protein